VVVVAAGREKRSAIAHRLHDIEAEDAVVEANRSVQVGHLQMNVADPDAGVDRGGSAGRQFLLRIGHRNTPY